VLDLPDDEGIEEAAGICRRYADLAPGLADASILVLAKKWRTRSIATLDHRHFSALRPLYGDAFELHPA
jgi:predicted nucleic acid-binding protein